MHTIVADILWRLADEQLSFPRGEFCVARSNVEGYSVPSSQVKPNYKVTIGINERKK